MHIPEVICNKRAVGNRLITDREVLPGDVPTKYRAEELQANAVAETSVKDFEVAF